MIHRRSVIRVDPLDGRTRDSARETRRITSGLVASAGDDEHRGSHCRKVSVVLHVLAPHLGGEGESVTPQPRDQVKRLLAAIVENRRVIDFQSSCYFFRAVETSTEDAIPDSAEYGAADSGIGLDHAEADMGAERIGEEIDGFKTEVIEEARNVPSRCVVGVRRWFVWARRAAVSSSIRSDHLSTRRDERRGDAGVCPDSGVEWEAV